MTWQDVKRIVNIADDLTQEIVIGCSDAELPTEEEYYKEVLKRYNNNG